MEEKNLFAEVDDLKKFRPNLSDFLDRALLGPDGQGPTSDFKECVTLACRNVWLPIEALLAQPVYQEPTAETPDQGLAIAKEAFYNDLRAPLAYLEKKAPDGELIVVGYQNRLVESETYGELLQVNREVNNRCEHKFLKSELNQLFTLYAHSSPKMMQLIVVERMFNSKKKDLTRIRAQLEVIKGCSLGGPM